MTPGTGTKVYDLEERTFLFAQRVRAFLKRVPRSIANFEDSKQLVRASGSVGANYIEGNDALGPKDRILRMRTSKKEAKEARYWLRLLDTGPQADCAQERDLLVVEATELMNIFAAIVRKLEAQLPQ